MDYEREDPPSDEELQILETLTGIIQRLYAETVDLQDPQGDLQLWYNRGYADGIVETLHFLGYKHVTTPWVGHSTIDTQLSEAFLPWGKAYRHGKEVATKDTLSVLGRSVSI